MFCLVTLHLNTFEFFFLFLLLPIYCIITAKEIVLKKSSFITVIATADNGVMEYDGGDFKMNRGDKYFIPAQTKITLKNAEALICYPPKNK